MEVTALNLEVVSGGDVGFCIRERIGGIIGRNTGRVSIIGNHYADRIAIAAALRETFDLSDLEADAYAASVYRAVWR